MGSRWVSRRQRLPHSGVLRRPGFGPLGFVAAMKRLDVILKILLPWKAVSVPAAAHPRAVKAVQKLSLQGHAVDISVVPLFVVQSSEAGRGSIRGARAVHHFALEPCGLLVEMAGEVCPLAEGKAVAFTM